MSRPLIVWEVVMIDNIAYPYLPEGRRFLYVPADNPFMEMAKEVARMRSLDKTMPCAAVVAKNDIVSGVGANGSDYHKNNKCQRVVLGCKTGEGYELCEGCHPKNHSESKAISNARLCGRDVTGADLYLWGHWWCCKSCWNVMIAAGIRNVYLLESSERLFNKEHPDNIVGRQFDAQ